MISEQEKTDKAKKSYEHFWQRLSEKQDDETNQLLPCYKTLTNGKVVQDYYWSDHEITPTALLRWINKHNNTTKKRTEWIKEIMLHPNSYDKLIDMYANFTEPLIVDDVLITKNSIH